MKKLSELPDDSKFYRGTIIVLKDLHVSPKGNFDCKYAMVWGNSPNLLMLDLYRSMGGMINHDITPNIPGHFAVNKEGIYAWVKQHLEFFYTEDIQKDFDFENRVFIEDLNQYFVQANRDLFL